VRSDETVLVQLDSAMKYLLPASDALGLTWTQEQFDDAGWAAGAYGVGYDAGAMIRTSVNSTADAVYTRADFSIVDLSAVETVWLAADYDDGYVAWINGVEVARRNMPTGDPTNTSTASSGHESSNGATPSYDAYIDVTAKAKPALHNGTNVLAVGVWNNDSGSTDLALVPRLSINRPVPPPGEVVWSLAGALTPSIRARPFLGARSSAWRRASRFASRRDLHSPSRGRSRRWGRRRARSSSSGPGARAAGAASEFITPRTAPRGTARSSTPC
jgi:hypothetical protein